MAVRCYRFGMATLILLAIVTLAAVLSILASKFPSLVQDVLPIGLAHLILVAIAAAIAGVHSTVVEGVQAMVIAVGLIVWSAFGGSYVVRSVFLLARRDGFAPTESLPASAWIGSVERALITMSLCLGLTEFAAVVLGVKALGQYQMSDNHGAAGRVLGTLSSSLWAVCCFAVFLGARHGY